MAFGVEGRVSVLFRSYRDADDLRRMKGCLSEAARRSVPSHVLHPGDLDWQLFHMADLAPSDLVGLWEREAGTLVGFVIVYPGFGGFDIQVHPDWRDGEREREMLAWAEARIAEIADGAGRESPGFFTLVDARDETRIDVLEERGYRRGGAWYRLARRLDATLTVPEVPDGFQIRGLAGEDDVVARAAVLAAAFGAEPDAERLPPVDAGAGLRSRPRPRRRRAGRALRRLRARLA